MDPEIWGPPMWFYLHSMTFQYCQDKTCATLPEIEKMKSFLVSLQYTLPCQECRDNYARHLRNNPIRLENRRALFNWVVDLHNSVNRETNEKLLRQFNGNPPPGRMKRSYTYGEVEDMYRKYYSQSSYDNQMLPATKRT